MTSEGGSMKRRDFIKLTVSGLAGLAFNDALASLNPGGLPELVVAQGTSHSRLTEKAIEALGGIKRFISRGDVVVVKPNMAWDRTPEQAANTNPEVVQEVVRLCYEAGAGKVKVFDRTVNDPRRAYVQSGIMEAVKKVGGEIFYVDDRKFKEVTINGEAIKTWPLYTEVFEADKVINIPVAKHHSLARLTMAMKNWMGIMGGSRRQIHQRLDESLADLAMVIKPTLTILDATRILIRNGPQGGNLEDVKVLNTVIAGIDQVAVDSFGATLFGMKGEDLGYVKIAHKRGLGNMDLSRVKIKRIRL
jgi:uncharacterized protein (DUF362 family)